MNGVFGDEFAGFGTKGLRTPSNYTVYGGCGHTDRHVSPFEGGPHDGVLRTLGWDTNSSPCYLIAGEPEVSTWMRMALSNTLDGR